MRDLVLLILSCPMKLGYEHYMWRWIQRVSNSRAQQGNLERLRHCLSERPLRHVKGIIPEDITEQIMNGGSIISEHVPPPILDLSYRLAVDQLVQSLLDSCDHFQWRMPVVWFLTRNDLEKRTVVEDIKANFQLGETFEILQIINLDWINEKFRYFEYPKWTDATALVQRRRDGWDFEVLKLPGKDKSHRKFMLLVDGDGDERVDFQKVDIPSDIRYSKDAVVIITTGSSTLQNDKLAYKMDAIIRIEDHVLPWEVFCKNVGKELVYSSSAIQRVAVQIVEECGGHLLAIVFAAKSLKHVEDVQIWEQTLQKLRYRSPSYKLIAFKHVSEVLVNAFINIIWEDEREKPRLNQCLNAFKLKAKMSKGELFGRWFFEQLIDNEKEAEHTLRELVETAILQEIEDIFGQYILLPEELKIILDAMSEKESHDNLTREPSGLTEPQKIWNSQKAASQFLKTFPIRSLNLSYSGIQSLPGFFLELDQLQTLSLTGCKQFNQLLPEINQFHHIKQLDLDGTSIMDLPHSLNCPGLRRLSLGNNLNLMKIPLKFFDRMPQLQTLDLSLTSIHDLPGSFYNLQELEHFYLRDCELFRELSPSIGQLTNLIELDLHGTQITHLPDAIRKLIKLNTLSLSFLGFIHGSGHENQSMPSSNFATNLIELDLGTQITLLPDDIEKLTKLNTLSLSRLGFPHGSGRENQSMPSPNIAMIPSDALLGLKNLVELCIDVNSDNEWWLKNVQRVLTEINTLRELRKLDMYIPRVVGVKYLEPVLQKLSSNFRFIVGHHMPRIISRVLPAVEEKFVASNGSLRFVNGEDFPNEVMLILSKAWAFFLDRHMTIKNLSQFRWSNLNQLRLCILAECNKLQSIVDGDEDLESSFGELQFLTIFYMKSLTSIINRETLGNCTFCKLKFLALHTCTELTTIFTKDVLYNFSHLEELIVEDCPKVRSIITCQSSGETTTSIFLPRLRKLSLLFVPELVSISSGVSFGRNLERIGFYYCPKLKSLSSKELFSQKLKHIVGESEWWGALNWSEWGQQEPPDKFSHIFFAIDEDLDILTQLTTYEVEAVGRTRQ
ncbi:uncharacterized protein LOC129295045 [Prosopis cineraria]|uniref:uncharacterized protein LOC129295045 n=1 Tax=Prosopis cineraria TaxID=364024 RepID=UPI00240EFB69|nr:uncharacterized protein LOC129295045 [Prosopis cineraria]